MLKKKKLQRYRGITRRFICRIIGRKMCLMGGRVRFYGIEGALIAKSRVLAEAKFPYALGYGLTETSIAAESLRIIYGRVIGKIVKHLSPAGRQNPVGGRDRRQRFR